MKNCAQVMHQNGTEMVRSHLEMMKSITQTGESSVSTNASRNTPELLPELTTCASFLNHWHLSVYCQMSVH